MKNTLTPMMKQYYELKKKHTDKFLFFRLGDFYELFGKDAEEASKILSIVLTQRHGIPMCGIPHHQFNNYAHKIINVGKKIAIAEQFTSKIYQEKIIERKVTKIISPGMVFDENVLEDKSNNFILFIYFTLEYKKKCVLLCIDISTGELFITSFLDEVLGNIKTFFTTYNPKEITILKENLSSEILNEIKKGYPSILINELSGLDFSSIEVNELIKKYFQVENIESLGIKEEAYLGVLRLLLYFIKRNEYDSSIYLQKPKFINLKKYLTLDHITLKHLEIFENQFDDLREFTLLKSLDFTISAMGGRLLKQFFKTPLKDINEIEWRLDKVEFLKNDYSLLTLLRGHLKKIVDLERLNIKIQNELINPKEIINLKNSLIEIQSMIKFLIEKQFNFFEDSLFIKEEIEKLINYIDKKFLREPNINIREGGVINPKSDEELKRNILFKDEGIKLLNDLELKVRRTLGFSSLKIKYSNNMGFFYEVSKTNSKRMPSSFFKKQTLVNVERFVDEELIHLEEKIINAKDLAIEKEIFIYNLVLDELKIRNKIFQTLAEKMALIDVLASFAELALKKDYIRPRFNQERKITLINAKHPIIENEIVNGEFIPNSLVMGDNNYIHIITGPNMAGKSTFLRQNALIFIMAQMGSFIPVESANIPIFDRIFTRIGSGDRLAKGESTFLVEMNEVANILHHSTENSFIIMDEIGRGTSTHDGLSLAWSILEYLANPNLNRAKTLFATHYHELGALDKKYSSIENYQILVKEEDSKIIFLKKVILGLANKSYGIYVAELSGIHKSIIDRAKIILRNLQNNSLKNLNNDTTFLKNYEKEKSGVMNPPSLYFPWIDKIKDLNINKLTPIEALSFLDQLQKEVEKMGEE